MRALRRLELLDDSIRARVRAKVAAALGQGPDEEAQIRAALVAFAELDGAGPREPLPKPACHEGCASCCHVHVEATRPELLAIVAHVRATWSQSAQRALRDALLTRVQVVAALDDLQRWQARVPCALLDARGRCSIHPVRPLRCRAFHSAEVEPCRAAFEGRGEADPVRIPLLARAQDAAEEGYDRALEGAGLPVNGLRLEEGLLALLEQREAL